MRDGVCPVLYCRLTGASLRDLSGVEVDGVSCIRSIIP